LAAGQEVLVSNPTRGKLDPRWTGSWEVLKQIDATSVKVKMGNWEQVIHMNRIRPLLEKYTPPTETRNWEPRLFTHADAPEETNEIPATTVVPQREPLGVAVLFFLWTIMVFDSHCSKNVGHAGTCTLGGKCVMCCTIWNVICVRFVITSSEVLTLCIFIIAASWCTYTNTTACRPVTN